jgi:hypothetical protein
MCRQRVLRFTVEHMIEIIVGVLNVRLRRGDAAARGDPRLVHAVPVARDQRMPRIEVLPFGNEAIGAGAGQPCDGAHVLRRQPHAVGHDRKPIRIVLAAAPLRVEQSAADAGEVDLAGVLVLELGQAAFAAAVAERFPLGGGHLLQRLGFPERLGHGAHVMPCEAKVKRTRSLLPNTILPRSRPAVAR